MNDGRRAGKEIENMFSRKSEAEKEEDRKLKREKTKISMETKRVRNKNREKHGGAGMQIMFYEIAMPDGSVKTVRRSKEVPKRGKPKKPASRKTASGRRS